ncbi:MAG: hypothetical protein KYX66_06755 [Blastomonas fulva]|uniref:hypothetical protein n=1 Tax=Blastomonas fulva TaxID=1550728 RepID=UPI0024E1BB52|nr:hypothetical protein [Blastomonas fulva]MDK2756419.1 hypothetical protein [Blastomonas fulva]
MIVLFPLSYRIMFPHCSTMRRIDQEELVSVLYQALKAAPATTKTGLRSKLALESDRAHNAMAKHIAARLSGASMAVVMAELVDNGYFGQRPGEWGKDEPAPE